MSENYQCVDTSKYLINSTMDGTQDKYLYICNATTLTVFDLNLPEI